MTYPIPDDFAATGFYFRAGTTPARRFQVVGERSSGTNFVKRMLGRNTPLKATEALGWKHAYPHALAIPDDLVVVLSIRAADAWALSMFAKPWHTRPDAQRLDFQSFLRAPWDTIVDREKYFDLPTAGLIGQPLQLDRDPMTGLPPANLFALRRTKLAAHLSFLNRGCAFCLVRMEEVTANPDRFIASFRAAYDLAPLAAGVKPVLKRLGSRFQSSVEARPDHPEAMEVADLAFMRGELDLGLEDRLGYRY